MTEPVNIITELFQRFITYVDLICGGNEMAVAFLVTGISSTALYMAKSIPMQLLNTAKKHLTTHMVIESSEKVYLDLMRYFEANKTINQSRYLRITNGHYNDTEVIKSFGAGTQVIHMFNKFVLLNMEEITLNNHIMYKIGITYLGRSHDLVNTIQEQTRPALCNQEIMIHAERTEYYTPNEPQLPIMSEENMEKLKGVQKFLDSKDEYIKKGIPYTLGILLHGVPGTGKTKLIRYLTDLLHMPVYIVNSVSALGEVPKLGRKLIIMEELDTVVGKREKVDSTPENTGGDKLMAEMNALSVGDLLKQLDNVLPADGRIIVASTNFKHKLDDAVIRPGRFDIHIEFKHVTLSEFVQYCELYYEETPNLNNRTIVPDLTGAVIQHSYLIGTPLCDFIEEFTNESQN